MITLNHLIPFPLTTLIIGGHEPQWVEDILTRVRELDEDARVVLVGYMILAAKHEMVRN